METRPAQHAAQESRRERFERAIKKLNETNKFAPYSLAPMFVNGEFSRYMEAATDDTWIGFLLSEHSNNYQRLQAEFEQLREWIKKDGERSEVIRAERDKLQALNAELLEALKQARTMIAHPDNVAIIDIAIVAAEAKP